MDDRRCGSTEHDPDGHGHEAPAREPGARIEALEGHARNASVAGVTRTSPGSVTRIWPRTSGRSSRWCGCLRADDDGGLGEGLGRARRARDDGRLGDVRAGRSTGPRIDQVVRGGPGPGPAVDRRARGGHAVAGDGIRTPREAHGGQRRSGIVRVGHPDLPAVVVDDAHGDVAVGVDHRGHARQEIERPVGEPALGHAIEVEAEPDRAVDDRAAPMPEQRPAARRGAGEPVAGSAGAGRRLRPAAGHRAARCRRRHR